MHRAQRIVLSSLLFALPLAFSRDLLGTFELPKLSLLLAAALGLLVLGGISLVRAFEAGRLRSAVGSFVREPLTGAVGLGLLVAAVSTARSLSPSTSFFGAADSYGGLLTWLGFAVLFGATRAGVRSCRDAREVFTGAVVASSFLVAYGLGQVLGLDPIEWQGAARFLELVRPSASLGHPLHLATYLAMLFPLLGLWAFEAGRQRRWLVLVVLVLTLIGCLVTVGATLSRSGWIALGVGAGLPLAGLVAFGKGRRVSRKLLLGAPLVVLCGSIVLGGLALRNDSRLRMVVRERVLLLTHLDGRLNAWSGAWNVFLEHPLTGSGLDTFHVVFPRHRSTRSWALEWGGTPNRAHNEPLHVLATTGALGGAAWLLLVLAAVRAAVQGLRQGAQRKEVLAVVAALAAWGVASLAGFTVVATGSLGAVLLGVLSRLGECGLGADAAEEGAPRQIPRWLVALAVPLVLLNVRSAQDGLVFSALLLVTLLVAVTAGRGVRPRELRGDLGLPTSRWGRGVSVALLSSALACAWLVVVRPLAANALLRRGWEQLASREAGALESFERAIATALHRDEALEEAGRAAHQAARMASDKTEKRRLLRRARGWFEEAEARLPEPDRVAQLASVEVELAALGERSPTAALGLWAQALELDPNNGVFLGDAAAAALLLGEPEQARRWATRATSVYGDFGKAWAQLGYLALDEGREEEASVLLARALEGRWHGDLAEEYAAAVNLCSALVGLERFEEAVAVGRRAAERSPREPAIRVNVGTALERLGRREEAVAEYRQALQHVPGFVAARQALERLGEQP